MTTLALLRHGQSEWNKQNRFTGWVDVDLTEVGVEEARRAGRLFKEADIPFDAAFTSLQSRAIRTLNLALEEVDLLWLPVTKDWRLNERHYGALTGLNKSETAEKHGSDQVKIWRRSFDTPPPPMGPNSEHDPAKDRRYAALSESNIPQSESLKTTLDRVSQYWAEAIAPRVEDGQSLIIAAHGNSLRALVKLLMGVSDEEIVSVEIPTGNPLVFEFDRGGVTPTSARYLDADRATALPPLPTR
ncbi:MAG: 2,3-diphosphoglycerate-dependent phosphoglycerate mutase [Pseudomonadota bacterium]